MNAQDMLRIYADSLPPELLDAYLNDVTVNRLVKESALRGLCREDMYRLLAIVLCAEKRMWKDEAMRLAREYPSTIFSKP